MINRNFERWVCLCELNHSSAVMRGGLQVSPALNSNCFWLGEKCSCSSSLITTSADLGTLHYHSSELVCVLLFVCLCGFLGFCSAYSVSFNLLVQFRVYKTSGLHLWRQNWNHCKCDGCEKPAASDSWNFPTTLIQHPTCRSQFCAAHDVVL